MVWKEGLQNRSWLRIRTRRHATYGTAIENGIDEKPSKLCWPNVGTWVHLLDKWIWLFKLIIWNLRCLGVQRHMSICVRYSITQCPLIWVAQKANGCINTIIVNLFHTSPTLSNHLPYENFQKNVNPSTSKTTVTKMFYWCVIEK